MTRAMRWGYAAMLAVIAAGWLFDFGGYPLLDPDEGRNAEVAREMAETNGYALPRLNGLPYLDKPVLHFAVTAAVFELVGAGPRAARVPSLAFTLATLGLLAWFGRRRLDGTGALTAVVAAASTPFVLAYARTVIFDATLTFFVVAALVCFYETIERAAEARPPDLWRAGAWASMAFGILTKGPVALLVPLLVAIPYAAWRRHARALVDPVAILLIPAVVVPWVAAVSRTVPDFASYVVVTETAGRLAGDSLGRAEPAWYFLAILPAAVLPWTLVLGAQATTLVRALRDRTARSPFTVYLVLWIAVPLLFFSLASGKRPQYILPLVPAAALLVADRWHAVRGALPGVRTAAVGLVLAGLAFLVGRDGIGALVPASTRVAAAIPGTAIGLGVACIVGGLAAWVGRRWRPVVLGGLALPVAAIPLVSAQLMDAIGADRSAAALADAITASSPPGVEVVAVHTFPLSLPFYLGRQVTLATDDASELTSNYLLRHPAVWRNAGSIRPGTWWRDAAVTCEHPRVFVVDVDDEARRETLARQLPILLTTRTHAAFGPCGPPALARGE